MPVDYLGLRDQAKEAARKAQTDIEEIGRRYEQAVGLLTSRALTLDEIKQRIEAAAATDPRLRCAKPTSEPLDQPQPFPALPAHYTLLAADGSQINPNPHEPVHYFLINLGAIEFFGGVGDAPEVHTESKLHYAEYTTSGSFSDEQVSLQRDKEERVLLSRLAKKAAAKQQPVLTLTDGPLELWGSKSADLASASFDKELEEYLASLDELHKAGAATAGYVDKPRADLLVRMLEVLAAPGQHTRLFRGVTDAMLLKKILAYGQRSAVFATQSQSAAKYTEHRALHFFYLNVGRAAPWLARVEIPAWVANNKELLDGLHAVLVEQSTILGSQAYPYVLHRAHEIALVKFEEHEQVSLLLINELKGLGVEPGELSQKAASKRLRGRRRHTL
jgi:hypothetical protein